MARDPRDEKRRDWRAGRGPRGSGLGPQGSGTLKRAAGHRCVVDLAELRPGESVRLEPDAPRPLVVCHPDGTEGFGGSIREAQAELDEVRAGYEELRRAA